MSIEIARGCTEGCRFCQAGMIYRPVRERDPEQIVDTRRQRGEEVAATTRSSLTSLSTADYSCISPLIKKVDRASSRRRSVSLGVSSLRAYGLDEELLDEIAQGARDAASRSRPRRARQRMRDVVNKNVTEEQLMETAERVFSRGWDEMKLYFMIGLPTEEDEDVRGIVAVGERARDVGKRVRKGKRGRRRSRSASRRTCPSRTRRFSGARWIAPASVARQAGHAAGRGAQRAGVELRMHDVDDELARRRLRARRSHARRRDRARLRERRALRLVGRAAQARRVGGGLRRTTASIPRRYLGTIPVTRAPPWDHIDVGLEEGFLAASTARR